MSELTGTELIRAILQAELDAVDAERKANILRKKYAEEVKEFVKSEIVEIIQGYVDPKWVRGTVIGYAFRTSPFGMVYTVAVRDENGHNKGHFKVSGANIRKSGDPNPPVCFEDD